MMSCLRFLPWNISLPPPPSPSPSLSSPSLSLSSLPPPQPPPLGPGQVLPYPQPQRWLCMHTYVFVCVRACVCVDAFENPVIVIQQSFTTCYAPYLTHAFLLGGIHPCPTGGLSGTLTDFILYVNCTFWLINLLIFLGTISLVLSNFGMCHMLMYITTQCVTMWPWGLLWSCMQFANVIRLALVSMYVCVLICVRTHVRKCIYTHVRVSVDKLLSTGTHVHVHVHVCTHVCTHTPFTTWLDQLLYAFLFVFCMCVCLCACVRTCVHTCTYMYTRTHAQTGLMDVACWWDHSHACRRLCAMLKSVYVCMH